jgi:hypothetical protein
MSDVLERIGAANPVPQEPPASAWTASVLIDEIDARRLQTTIDVTVTSLGGSPTRSRGTRIAAAAGAFVLVLAVVGVIGLIANGGASDVVDTPPTQTTEESLPTTDAVSTAESFFTAFLIGDWDAANELAQGFLISGGNELPYYHVDNLLWGVDVVGIDCELVTEFLVTEFLVSCTSTQTDTLTRQVDTAYTWQSVGTMLVVDGVVTWYHSAKDTGSLHHNYETWLDDESPDGWHSSECSQGGYLTVGCLPLYLANVEAWLATDPDFRNFDSSDIDEG